MIVPGNGNNKICYSASPLLHDPEISISLTDPIIQATEFEEAIDAHFPGPGPPNAAESSVVANPHDPDDVDTPCLGAATNASIPGPGPPNAAESSVVANPHDPDDVDTPCLGAATNASIPGPRDEANEFPTSQPDPLSVTSQDSDPAQQSSTKDEDTSNAVFPDGIECTHGHYDGYHVVL